MAAGSGFGGRSGSGNGSTSTVEHPLASHAISRARPTRKQMAFVDNVSNLSAPTVTLQGRDLAAARGAGRAATAYVDDCAMGTSFLCHRRQGGTPLHGVRPASRRPGGHRATAPAFRSRSRRVGRRSRRSPTPRAAHGHIHDGRSPASLPSVPFHRGGTAMIPSHGMSRDAPARRTGGPGNESTRRSPCHG